MINRDRLIKFSLCGLLYCVHSIRTRSQRRWAVHPLNKHRNAKEEYEVLVKELEQYPGKYHQYFRMTKDRFEFILKIIAPRLKGNITSPKEKLVITLKYLASGSSFSDLATRFRLGKSSVRKYILETVIAIGEEMGQITMPKLKKKDWRVISNEFYKKWNFPNCLGASDGTVFWNSAFGKMWFNQSEQLRLPDATKLPGTHQYVPYQLIADDAFGQTSTILTPFPGRKLNKTQRCFNYRLSRARRIVENAFGILTHTWGILLKRIQVQKEFAKKIVIACVVLHNFLRMSKSEIFSNLNEHDDDDANEDESNEVPSNVKSMAINRSPKAAMEMRNTFANWCERGRRCFSIQNDLNQCKSNQCDQPKTFIKL